MKFSHILTVDVEDWFHLNGLPPNAVSKPWNQLPSRVEENTRCLLKIFSRTGRSATFFFLGDIARRFPHLVKEVMEAGHEIACNGDQHKLIPNLGREGFRKDLQNAKKALLDAGAPQPKGFRAPSFSLNPENTWLWEILKEEDFSYDASLFPAKRADGGWEGGEEKIFEPIQGMTEIPCSTLSFFGKRIGFSGGGYLRLFPFSFLRWAIKKKEAQNQPVILYIHPRDIDPDQPRLSLPPWKSFKTYTGLKGCHGKLEKLLNEFSFKSIRKILEEQRNPHG